MNIELITYNDCREPQAHIARTCNCTTDGFVPNFTFEAEKMGVEAVTVFKSKRRMKRFLAGRGYKTFREISHTVYSV